MLLRLGLVMSLVQVSLAMFVAGCKSSSGQSHGDDAATDGQAADSSQPDGGTGPCVPPDHGLFVALNGDDGNDGSADHPFATLHRAQVEIRAIKAAGGLPVGGLTVWVHGGVYQLSTPLVLDEQDSGEQGSPVVFAAHPCDPGAVVAGGMVLPPSGFFALETDDPNWDGFPQAARDSIMVFDLGSLTSDYGSLEIHLVNRHNTHDLELNHRGLVYNHALLDLARWPNKRVEDGHEFAYSDVVMGEVPAACWSSGGCAYNPSACTYFGYSEANPDGWVDSGEIWIESPACAAWQRSLFRVSGVDVANSRFNLDMNTVAPTYGLKPGSPYFVFNVREELDTPGEWFLDTVSGHLYVIPPDGSMSQTDLILFPILRQPVIELRNTHHITLSGLTVEGGRQSLVSVFGGHDNTIERSRLIGSTWKCMDMSTFDPLGSNEWPVSTRLSASEVGHCYLGMSGYGVRNDEWDNLVAQEVEVADNVFHDIGWYGIYLAGRIVGWHIHHNLFRDTRHVAIRFAGMDHLIEKNELTRVVSDISDFGAIYGGFSFVNRCTIRHNFIHDIRSSSGLDVWGQFANGIYLDEGVSGVTVYGNIVHDVPFGVGIFHCGGMHNSITNNILSKTMYPYGVLNNLSWIVQPTSEGHSHLFSDLYPVPFHNSAWSAAHPDLAMLPAPICDPAWNNPACCSAYSGRSVCNGGFSESCTASYADSNNCCCQAIDSDYWASQGWNGPFQSQFTTNVCWGSTQWDGSCSGDFGYGGSSIALATINPTGNLEGVDPLFVDEDGGDMNLAPNSPVFTQLPAFVSIPFDDIGPRD